MKRAMTYPHKPYFRFGALSQQALRCDKSSFTQSIIAGLDIDSHDLALIACFDLSAHLSLVYFIASPSSLFGRVTWMLY
jgi:hypothetical protein